MKHIYSLLILVTISVCACQTTTKHPENSSPIVESPDDFEAFYKRFHSDTAFQAAHIVWPLPGRPSMLDTTVQYDGGAFFWQREQWQYHVPFEEGGEFNRTFEAVSDVMVNETFEHTSLPVVVLRRFAKTSEGWMLIFYAGPGN